MAGPAANTNPSNLPQTEETQYRDNDDNEPYDIDYVIHPNLPTPDKFSILRKRNLVTLLDRCFT